MTATADGALLVDKPSGVSSYGVTAIVKRALGVSRVGHGGTLDPAATGLLLLLLGRSTRLLPYVATEPKEYEAVISFGHESDTDDASGAVTSTAPPPDAELVLRGIAELTGEIQQVPPAVSAKQKDGVRAYRAARRGRPLNLPATPVHVYSWSDVTYHDNTLRARILTGPGTYIRSLARDLGRLCHSAAHLASLRRTALGSFRVERAFTLDDVIDGHAVTLPPLDALGQMPREPLSDDAAQMIRHGRRIPATVAGEHAALLASDGSLVAVAIRVENEWKPRVVLSDA